MVMQSMFVVISTHTLTWSVTVVTADFAVFATYFNSHAHVERDQIFISHYLAPLISTHTLTWSVTKSWQNLVFSKIFQLTRSRGA